VPPHRETATQLPQIRCAGPRTRRANDAESSGNRLSIGQPPLNRPTSAGSPTERDSSTSHPAPAHPSNAPTKPLPRHTPHANPRPTTPLPHHTPAHPAPQ